MSGDYGGYQAIVNEANDLAEDERQRPLLSCPSCGTPLVTRADGMRACPTGDYRTWAQTWGEAAAEARP